MGPILKCPGLGIISLVFQIWGREEASCGRYEHLAEPAGQGRVCSPQVLLSGGVGGKTQTFLDEGPVQGWVESPKRQRRREKFIFAGRGRGPLTGTWRRAVWVWSSAIGGGKHVNASTPLYFGLEKEQQLFLCRNVLVVAGGHWVEEAPWLWSSISGKFH